MTPARRGAEALWALPGGAGVLALDGFGETWWESLTEPGRVLVAWAWSWAGDLGRVACAWCATTADVPMGAPVALACGCGEVVALAAWPALPERAPPTRSSPTTTPTTTRRTP